MQAATVAVVEGAPPLRAAAASPPRLLDPESRAWVDDLRAGGLRHEQAIGRLHELLLGAARRCLTCAATSSTTSRPKPRTTR